MFMLFHQVDSNKKQKQNKEFHKYFTYKYIKGGDKLYILGKYWISTNMPAIDQILSDYSFACVQDVWGLQEC